MGFFDTLFGGGAEKEAANKNRGLFDLYGKQGTTFLDNGLAASKGYLEQAGAAFDPLSAIGAKYGKGTDLYLDYLGVNGADGNARATAAFTPTLSYNFNRDQALEAVNRRRSTSGMWDSGNTDRDLLDVASGIASKEQNSWADRLAGLISPELTATSAAASGKAGVAGSLADLYQTDAQNRIGLAGNVTSGQVSANNTEAAGKASGAKNLLNAGLSLATLAVGGMGGFGGMGSALSSMGTKITGAMSAAPGGWNWADASLNQRFFPAYGTG